MSDESIVVEPAIYLQIRVSTQTWNDIQEQAKDLGISEESLIVEAITEKIY